MDGVRGKPAKKKAAHLLVAVGVFLFLLFAYFFFVKPLAVKYQAYQGMVVDKVRYTVGDGGGFEVGQRTRKYYLIISTDAGEQVRVEVTRSMYKEIEKGERVVKHKGEMYPHLEDVEP